MPYITYEESVQEVRKDPQLSQTVKDCSLDEDVIAAHRYVASEECEAVR